MKNTFRMQTYLQSVQDSLTPPPPPLAPQIRRQLLHLLPLPHLLLVHSVTLTAAGAAQ